MTQTASWVTAGSYLRGQRWQQKNLHDGQRRSASWMKETQHECKHLAEASTLLDSRQLWAADGCSLAQASRTLWQAWKPRRKTKFGKKMRKAGWTAAAKLNTEQLREQREKKSEPVLPCGKPQICTNRQVHSDSLVSFCPLSFFKKKIVIYGSKYCLNVTKHSEMVTSNLHLLALCFSALIKWNRWQVNCSPLWVHHVHFSWPEHQVIFCVVCSLTLCLLEMILQSGLDVSSLGMIRADQCFSCKMQYPVEWNAIFLGHAR